MKKIYLAGFDVFYADAVLRGEKMKQQCQQYGFCGLFPLDNEADNAEDICRGNLGLIDSADYVIANLNPFRGAEPDSGTCFEIGYAVAKGKKVYAYLENGQTMREKLGEVDEKGFFVEDFQLPVNLMLACTATICVGGLEDCLRKLKNEG